MHDVELANHILNEYKNGGTFDQSLYKTVINADLSNLQKLYKSYPSLVASYCKIAGLEYCETIIDGKRTLLLNNKNEQDLNIWLNKADNLLKELQVELSKIGNGRLIHRSENIGHSLSSIIKIIKNALKGE